MVDTILAKKIRMTQTYESGARVPVTILQAGPCVVTSVKNQSKDGYNAVQIGFGERKLKNIPNSLAGHLKETTKENKAPKTLKEVKVEEDETLSVGSTFSVSDVFTAGDTIQVTGISKGKGFAGGVRRYGFRGGPKTHGQSDRQRSPGSIGQGTTPGRVYKGKRMAGHLGVDQVTIKNLRVVSVNSEKNELWLSGPIPGAKGSVLVIRRLSENKVVPMSSQVESEPEQTVAAENANS